MAACSPRLGRLIETNSFHHPTRWPSAGTSRRKSNRAYARKFKKRKMRNDGRGEGAGNGVTGTANNGGAAD